MSLALMVLISSLAMPATGLSENELLIVVISQNSDIESITPRQVRRLFLGKSIKLPNGSRAKLATFKSARSQFNKRALKRTDAQVDAAWSRLKFSGKALEPLEFSDPELLQKYLEATPNSIGYLTTTNVTAQLRSLLVIR